MAARRGRLAGRCCAIVAVLAAASCGAHDGADRTGGPATQEIVFRNAVVLTMDDTRPRAEAVLVRGDRIAAVGGNQEVLGRAGPRASIIDLSGRTIVPGFIDAHSHRLGDFANVGYRSAADVVPDTLAQGWTGLHELFVNQERLDMLRTLDRTGRLPLRVDAYLPVNSPEVTPYGDWYSTYRPGQVVSPHVRVAGLKFFVDYDSGRQIRWSQHDLSQAIVTARRQGWQVAAKSIGSATLEMLLNAFDEALGGRADPAWRPRVEHILSVTPAQAARMRQLGAIAVFQANIPGQLVGDKDFEALVRREPPGAIAPWRMLMNSRMAMAGGTGWPSYFVNEPTGPPFASPVRLLYQAVTRAGNLGMQPEPWMRGQSITVAQALRAYTMGSAYAVFAEKDRGSITRGKLADLVVLSQNPLDVGVDDILHTRVLMTMIGGRAEWCGPDAAPYCPPPPASPPAASPPAAPASAARLVAVRPGQPVRIALVAPTSGPPAALGRAERNAASLAISDVGAMHGFEVRVTTIDDGCDPTRGPVAAEQVAAGGFLAVLGPTCSAAGRTELPSLDQAGTATVSCTATQPDLPALAPHVFNRTVLDEDQMRAAGVDVSYVDKLATVATLYTRYAERFGALPPVALRPFIGYCYDATMVLLRAIQRTASVGHGGVLTIDRVALATSLRETAGHAGVTGTITFDAAGNRTR